MSVNNEAKTTKLVTQWNISTLVYDSDSQTFEGSIKRPNGTTIVEDAVGLLNMYEYQSSYKGTTYKNGYLNNGLQW